MNNIIYILPAVERKLFITDLQFIFCLRIITSAIIFTY
ncbi:hypothetical protein ADIARSV_2343 [Arcticibacter svalbardensis MN12-7]|uniref:Uncharacterized protein n=1 Tax=Arcticibacter svalbardensis MN12-7 TaxID=1150600 RepID=R9GRL9_9SPHI|nr:hypothetical protein ADIARSV_2343 [Arcticibacter svalbardensis MN12-7]